MTAFTEYGMTLDSNSKNQHIPEGREQNGKQQNSYRMNCMHQLNLKPENMRTQKSSYKKSLFIAALFLTGLAACRCDAIIDPNSPASQIAESEKLVIPAAVDLPVKSPNGNVRVATFFAEGVQKYKSQLKAGSNPQTFEWVFVAPQANLYNAKNEKVGTHSVGPAWQLSGSITDSIYGQQFSPPKSAPSPDPNSIDWLLLMPKTGTVPTGIFSNVSYIQRIATNGGKAPATLPKSADETVDVKYTAVYRFTKG